MNKRIIITADDFGVVPSINAAITKAVLEGKVNSVAVLTNYGDQGAISVQRTKELIKLAANQGVSLDIGVHLTISSGQPLLQKSREKAMGMCDTKENFKSFTEINKKSIISNGGLVQLKAELLEQINVLKRNGITPKHLSCHHNTLLCFEELFQVYVEVALESKLPMRSVIVQPSMQRNLYTNLFLNIQLRDDNTPKYLHEMALLLKQLADRFALHSQGKVLTPGYVDAAYYGPIPAARIMKTALSRKCEAKKEHLIKILSRFQESNNETMEFMVHLRDGEVSFWKTYKDEVKATGYSGIDHKYFDSRVVEFRALMESDLTSLLSLHAAGYGGWDEFGFPVETV